MEVLIISEGDGLHRMVPFLRFKIGIYDRETYFVMGEDTTGLFDKQTQPGYIIQRLGLLSELHASLQNDILERMITKGWSMSQYPDPDIILVTTPIAVFSDN